MRAKKNKLRVVQRDAKPTVSLGRFFSFGFKDDMETPVECYAKLLAVHLASRSSVQRTVVANVLAEWALAAKSQPPQLVKQVRASMASLAKSTIPSIVFDLPISLPSWLKAPFSGGYRNCRSFFFDGSLRVNQIKAL